MLTLSKVHPEIVSSTAQYAFAIPELNAVLAVYVTVAPLIPLVTAKAIELIKTIINKLIIILFIYTTHVFAFEMNADKLPPDKYEDLNDVKSE